MVGAGFRDVSEYRWIMLQCKDAYEKVSSDPKITFKQGQIVVKSICDRFNLSPKQFWLTFKNFSGDAPFTSRGKPFVIGILFFIATHLKQNWLDLEVLKKMKTNINFSLKSCSYEDALKLLILPAPLNHLRSLDFCHGVSRVLGNIQKASGLAYRKCKGIQKYFTDIENILDALDNQTNTGKRLSKAKKSYSNYLRD